MIATDTLSPAERERRAAAHNCTWDLLQELVPDNSPACPALLARARARVGTEYQHHTLRLNDALLLELADTAREYAARQPLVVRHLMEVAFNSCRWCRMASNFMGRAIGWDLIDDPAEVDSQSSDWSPAYWQTDPYR